MSRPYSTGKRYPKVQVVQSHHWTGPEIAALRKRLNVSMETMAAIFNVTRVSYGRWENGIQETEGTYHRVLDMLDAHPEWFLGRGHDFA